MNAPVPNPPPQGKKGSSGCLLALGITGGVLLLLAGVVGVVAWRVLKSDTAQEIIGFIGDATEVTQRALNAPGTEQLRQQGCEQAMVMDFDDFARMADRHFRRDGGLPLSTLKGRMVTCALAVGSAKTPSCDEIAATYVRAVGGRAGSSFTALVQRQGSGDGPLCQADYDEGGRRQAEKASPPESPEP
jgi:hypothetical protein